MVARLNIFPFFLKFEIFPMIAVINACYLDKKIRVSVFFLRIRGCDNMLGVRGDGMSEDEIRKARNRSVKLECYFFF